MTSQDQIMTPAKLFIFKELLDKLQNMGTANDKIMQTDPNKKRVWQFTKAYERCTFHITCFIAREESGESWFFCVCLFFQK